MDVEGNKAKEYEELFIGADETKIRLIQRLDSANILETQLFPSIDKVMHLSSKATPSTLYYEIKDTIYLSILFIQYKNDLRTNIFEKIQSSYQSHFTFLIESSTHLYINKQTPPTIIEKKIILQFLILCYRHIDISFIKTHMQKLSSIFLWVNLTQNTIKEQLLHNPKLIKNFLALSKFNQLEEGGIKSSSPCIFFNELINDFLMSFEESFNESDLDYYIKLFELLIEVLSIYATRKFMLPLLKEKQFIERIKLRQVDDSRYDQIFDLFNFYYEYEINEDKKAYIDHDSYLGGYYEQLNTMQGIAYQLFPEQLTKVFTENISFTDSRDNLGNIISALSHDEIYKLLSTLKLLKYDEEFYEGRTDLLKEIFIIRYERKKNIFDKLTEMSLYPTEDLLYNYDLVPERYSIVDYKPLLIPKLSLQYLTYYDYLLKNYLLFKFESAYEIRNDIEDVIERMCPSYDKSGRFNGFEGWSLMGYPLKQFQIITVKPALIGEPYSSEVIAEIEYSLKGVQTELKHEWDALRKHEVLFLLFFDNEKQKPIIRGCEVISLYDEVNNEFVNYNLSSNKEKPIGFQRRCMIRLDSVQYANDLLNEMVNLKFNLLIRRKAKTNNFKPILQTIKSLMKISTKFPSWLEEPFLSFTPLNKPKQLDYSFDYFDTFISKEHYDSFNSLRKLLKKEYIHLSIEKRNMIEFTQKQIEAIENGMNKGLSIIVGPPGTGKTDVAVQIVNLLHHNYPNEKILIITHSNYALNDIFEKIAQLSIDKKYLLRLGMGSKDINEDYNYSVNGQINYLLTRRSQLLDYILYLAQENNIFIFEEYTCESAINMINHYLLPQKEAIELKMNISLDQILQELNELRVFELLRDQSQRRNHLIKAQCKIIAMTCTHAALNRDNFLSMGFEYDTIIIEESAQIIEIETFIPLTLQKNIERLKRMIMLGDQNQLPPIIQSSALKIYSEMDMSLFTRLLRNNISHIELDYQGRARPSIVDLYRWRYPNLKDMNHTTSFPQNHNIGFLYCYQFINVDDYDNRGEIRTDDCSYQNLAEAEYAIGLFMFMCLIGYDPKTIVLLTPYNGQKDLLKEIYDKKCYWNDIFKGIKKISTVDKYQGQQGDYVILSLTRTKSIGHIRDIRRFVVALSRARLGLYVLGRWKVFEENQDMKKTMDLFAKNSRSLELYLPMSNDDNITEKAIERNKITVEDFRHMYRITQELIKIKLSH